MYDNHVISVLTSFYLDINCNKVYHGRWDVWLLGKQYTDEYFYLLMKSDEQIAVMTDKAQKEAEKIKKSKLSQAMDEN